MDVSSRRKPKSKGFHKKQIKSKIGCGVCGAEDGKYKCPKCRLPYCSVKCCKDHKKQCPALININQESTSSTTNTTEEKLSIEKCSQDSTTNMNMTTKMNTNTNITTNITKKSEYLPSDALTADPFENAIRRRKMIDEDDDSDDDEIDEHGWRITKDMMDRIDNSSWLRKELADGGLRQIIATIDNAEELLNGDGNGLDDCNDKKKRGRKRQRLNAVQALSAREAGLERAKHTNPKFAQFLDKLMLTAGVLVQHDSSSISGGADGDIEQSLKQLLQGENDLGNLSLPPLPSRRQLNLPVKDHENESSADENDSASDNDD